MGGGHSCESQLTAADTELSNLQAQLTALDTTSTCAKKLSIANSNLASLNKISTSVASGTDICTSGLSTEQAKNIKLQTTLNNTQNSPCNQNLKSLNNKLTTGQTTQKAAQNNYNKLIAAEKASQAAALQQIKTLTAQLLAEQQKYNNLEYAANMAASSCSNSLSTESAQITLLGQQLATLLANNLQSEMKDSTLTSTCTAQMAAAQKKNNENLNELSSQLNTATTNNLIYNTNLITNLADNASYTATLNKNSNTISSLTSTNSSLVTLLNVVKGNLNLAKKNSSNLTIQLNTLNSQIIAATKSLNQSEPLIAEAINTYLTQLSTYKAKISNLQSQIQANVGKYNTNFDTSKNFIGDVSQWGWLGGSVGPINFDGSNAYYNIYNNGNNVSPNITANGSIYSGQVLWNSWWPSSNQGGQISYIWKGSFTCEYIANTSYNSMPNYCDGPGAGQCDNQNNNQNNSNNENGYGYYQNDDSHDPGDY